MIVQPDGKILVGGNFISINGNFTPRLARLNPDGSVDFNHQPISLFNSGAIFSMALQPDGKILIGGILGEINNQTRNGIARLNPDFALDSFYPNPGGVNGQVEAIARQADGNVLIGGYFQTVAGFSRPYLARLLNTPNAAPVLSNVAVTTPISENGSAALTGNISDADAGDSFTLTVNWGDGSAPQTFNYPAGSTSFSETHQYLDDNPTATPSDNYTISLTLSDGSLSDTASTTVTVNNAAPVLSNIAVSPATINVGGSTTLSGNITDVGTLDTHQIVINWGDGSSNTTLNLAAGVNVFSAAHQYNTSGTFNIGITATDDDTGSSSGGASVTVNQPPPVVPNAPSNLTATAVSTTQVNLAWTDNSGNESGFLIERCAGSGKCTTFIQIAQTVANVNVFSDTGLTAATNYSYRVRAFNAAGNSAYSNTAKAKTLRR